ncbi:MAG TPA: biopolymer transporter ExbD [Bdellovibrionales bacterium]|nr:biopolymer transporter ExbD [Bdellovibrionales bacterium]
MRHNKKHLDFEINLIPCIDLLSVCICFLLLTAVWLQVGSLNVKQAIGGQSAAETEKRAQLWVTMGEGGAISLNLKQSAKVPAKLATLTFKGVQGRTDVAEVNKAVTQFKTLDPELRTVLIQPQMQTDYEEIIGLMDEFKRAGLTDLGVVPL